MTFFYQTSIPNGMTSKTGKQQFERRNEVRRSQPLDTVKCTPFETVDIFDERTFRLHNISEYFKLFRKKIRITCTKVQVWFSAKKPLKNNVNQMIEIFLKNPYKSTGRSPYILPYFCTVKKR
jgi:hypothetical protein